MSRIHISTDGAVKMNSGAGGWAVVIRTEDDTEELSGAVEDTTSPRMELRAILEGLKHVPDGEDVVVRGDNEMMLDVSEGTAKARANTELVEKIRSEAEHLDVVWKDVDAHSGDTDNERADTLAKRKMRELHDEITDGEPYAVRGSTSEVKATLKEYGLRWDVARRGYVTWDRQEWERAVEEVGAEIESENVAVL